MEIVRVRLDPEDIYQHRRRGPRLLVAPRRFDRLISSAWRMWVNGDDVYVANRNLVTGLKVSLHATGK